MSFTKITASLSLLPQISRALALCLLITLPAIGLAEEGALATAQPSATTSQPTAVAKAAEEKKHDLAGFFTIGAIINILFLGAVIYWARKEMQKGKQKKSQKKA